MVIKIFIAWLVMASCVVVHALGLIGAIHWTKRHRTKTEKSFWQSVRLLLGFAGWTILLHLVEIALWALLYYWFQGMPDMESSLYFSAVTYTTTGYGDLVLPTSWRLVAGVEALTGILMCGLSTGFFFAVMSQVYKKSLQNSSVKSTTNVQSPLT